MATSNVTLTKAWQKVANGGDEFFLSFPGVAGDPQIEVATAASEPTVQGHRLTAQLGEQVNRTLIGPGDVWARARTSEVTIVLSAWTP